MILLLNDYILRSFSLDTYSLWVPRRHLRVYNLCCRQLVGWAACPWSKTSLCCASCATMSVRCIRRNFWSSRMTFRSTSKFCRTPQFSLRLVLPNNSMILSHWCTWISWEWLFRILLKSHSSLQRSDCSTWWRWGISSGAGTIYWTNRLVASLKAAINSCMPSWKSAGL